MRRYDSTANIYDMRYAEEQTAKIKAALEDVKLDEQSMVLDAGCGTGLLFGHVSDKAKTVVGLDVSRKTLEQSEKRARLFPNVHLVLADADRTPFMDETFSHVFAVTLIQNTPNPVETLGEIKRVTKRNGEIVVTALKRVFTSGDLTRLAKHAELKIAALHGEGLQCYVATLR
jgi:ubiquinone/menaquinone biosynthesis C-methylase UbiE